MAAVVAPDIQPRARAQAVIASPRLRENHRASLVTTIGSTKPNSSMAYFVLAIKGQVRISSVAGPATMVPALGELGSVFGLILSCVLISALN